ncbi:MAG: hypothetical protein II189_05375 [Lachnospiraceae bacterium]|nr:hypothetical protein [Lachnospiraceae bacterium]
MTVFRRIVSVFITAVLVLPLFACSAEKPVRELFEAYVSEKDSVIRERPREASAEEEEASYPESAGREQVLTADRMPETEMAQEAPVEKREVRTSVETVRSEVVPEVEKAPEKEAPVREEEPADAPKEADAETVAPEETAAAGEETEAVQESIGAPEAAESYAQESAPASLGGGAVTLAPGSAGGHLLKLDEEGILLTLTVQETVYDVYIGSSTGAHQYNASFQSSQVEGGTAISIQALISPDEPDISISWTSSEGYGYLKFVSVSAKDGVPMLVTVE